MELALGICLLMKVEKMESIMMVTGTKVQMMWALMVCQEAGTLVKEMGCLRLEWVLTFQGNRILIKQM